MEEEVVGLVPCSGYGGFPDFVENLAPGDVICDDVPLNRGGGDTEGGQKISGRMGWGCGSWFAPDLAEREIRGSVEGVGET